jgi:hypothetical protein
MNSIKTGRLSSQKERTAGDYIAKLILEPLPGIQMD